jgi:hypothetical protein
VFFRCLALQFPLNFFQNKTLLGFVFATVNVHQPPASTQLKIKSSLAPDGCTSISPRCFCLIQAWISRVNRCRQLSFSLTYTVSLNSLTFTELFLYFLNLKASQTSTTMLPRQTKFNLEKQVKSPLHFELLQLLN